MWKSFNDEYLVPNNLTFEQLTLSLGGLMSEAGIYGEWLLYSKKIDIIPINPIFKFYHWKEMYDFESKNGLYDIEKLKENYLGIVMQSNWS